MRQDFSNDMQQDYLLNLTCDKGINKRQRYAMLACTDSTKPSEVRQGRTSIKSAHCGRVS